MANLKNLQKVERNIRYDPVSDTYIVMFNFATGHSTYSFPTLEHARVFRDSVYKAKLDFKIKKEIQKIRKKDDQDIYVLKPFPFNLIDALRLPDSLLTPELVSDLENINNPDSYCYHSLSPKLLFVVSAYYKDEKTLQKIGVELGGVTRERARQLIAKAVHKIRFAITHFEQFQNNKFKERLIQEIKDKPFLNEEIARDIRLALGLKSIKEVEMLNAPISSLDLSCRSYNCLERAGIETVGQLMELSIEQISRIRNLGRKSLLEIQRKMEEIKNEM